MSTQKNQPFRPTAREIDDVTKKSKREGLKGSLVGGISGALIGRKYKSKLVGAAIGATAGDLAGRRIGRRAGARDVVESRKALLQSNQLAELLAQVNELKQCADRRDLDRNGNDYPKSFPQAARPQRKSVRGIPSEPGLGVSAEALFAEERQDIASRWGWGIAASLDDDELDDEHAKIMHDVIIGKMESVNSPSAGLRSGEDFERAALATHLGVKAVDAMGKAEVHVHYLAAARRGLVELSDEVEATSFALINRTRNGEGQFAPDAQASSVAIQNAYSPTRRKTGIESGAGIAAGAAGIGALALLRARKGRRPRLTNGNTVDVPATTFSMGSPGSYIVRRARLKGKKPPLGIHPRHLGKGKKHSLAFMIHDDAFPLVPAPQPKLPKGMRQRVPLAKSHAEVLRRLKSLTQLSSGIGKVVAETVIDTAARGADNSAKKKKAIVNSVDQPRTLDSALDRIASMNFAIGDALVRGTTRYAPEVGAIAAGDVIGQDIHDRLRDRKRRRLLRPQKGIEAVPPMNGMPTSLSSIDLTLTEFDDRSAHARAYKRAEAVGAATVGGAAGAYASLATQRPGRPVQPGEDLRGKQVFVKRKSVIPSFHAGIGGESGIVHRMPGRDNFREIKPSSFRKIGTGGLRVEDASHGRNPDDVARTASRAKGTSAGRYSTGGNNCEHGVSRILSGKSTSRQVRRAIGGAALGGLAASTIDRFIGGRKEQGK